MNLEASTNGALPPPGYVACPWPCFLPPYERARFRHQRRGIEELHKDHDRVNEVTSEALTTTAIGYICSSAALTPETSRPLQG